MQKAVAVLLAACGPLLAVAAAAYDELSLLQTQANAPVVKRVTQPLTSAQKVEQLRVYLQANAGDLDAQREGCEAVITLANTQREGPGPYGGRRISDELLVAGIGGAFVEGLRNAMALEVAQGLTSPGPASEVCLGGLSGLTVQNDYHKGLLLITHTPGFWEPIMSMFNAYRGSTWAYDNVCFFAGMFGTPQPEQAASTLVEAGAVDWIMAWLEDESIKSDPVLFQRVFCGLSDIVHESSGVVARAMVSYQGSLPGIPLLVRSLRWAKESNSTFHEGNGFGLLYEGVHDVGGVLEHDDAEHSWAKAFVSEGLLEELMPTMRMEPNDRVLQDMSCEVIKWVTDDNVEVQTRLVEMGALETIAQALTQLSHPPSLGYGGVTIACSRALLNFARTSVEWRDRLRSLGVYDTLDGEVLAAFPPSENADFIARQRWFSNADIYALKDTLAPEQ